MKPDLIYFVLLPALANAVLGLCTLAIGIRSRRSAIAFAASVYLLLVGLFTYEYWSQYRPDPSPVPAVVATHCAIAVIVWAPAASIALLASRKAHPWRTPWSFATPIVGAVLGASWFLVACHVVSVLLGGECI